MEFNPITFIISLLIGIIIAYFMSPPPKFILRNPTFGSNNIDDTIYNDNNAVCYKYYKEFI